MAEWDVVFERSVEQDDQVLRVVGEVDLAVAGRFGRELDSLFDDGSARAFVDLSGVDFIDSSGVRELLRVKRAAESTGGELILRAPSASCRHVLEISGVWRDFEVQGGPE